MSLTPTTTTFADEVRAVPGGETLDFCFACGTCVSKCMVQQKVDPDYNPRRLLRMVMEDLREEAYQSPTTWLCTACDICYPACPQEIHISAVINAVKARAVNHGHATALKTAIVNQQTCVACGLCAEVCPYDAITIIEAKVPYRGLIQLASVDPGRCMACGICSAVCRSTSIELSETSSDEAIITKLWDWMLPEGGIH